MQSLESGSGQDQYVAIGEAVSFCFWHQTCHSSFVKVFQILKCSFCKFSWIFVFHCEEAGYWVVILKFCDRVCGQQWWAVVSSGELTSLHSFMVSVQCWQPFLAGWLGCFAVYLCLAMLFLYRNLVSIGKASLFHQTNFERHFIQLLQIKTK